MMHRRPCIGDFQGILHLAANRPPLRVWANYAEGSDCVRREDTSDCRAGRR